MKGNIMKNRKGFTLAEVLVTLAVIGIVAALTIPTLIQSSSQKQAKTSIKKAMSVLNQALAMSIAENSLDANATNQSADLKGLFGTYLSAIQSTDTSITTADGMKYTFYKADGINNCKLPTYNHPGATGSDANCMIELDINGNAGSSIPSNIAAYSDLYYFIVSGSSIVPVNASTGTPFDPEGIGDFTASTAGAVDNVAIDALIN